MKKFKLLSLLFIIIIFNSCSKESELNNIDNQIIESESKIFETEFIVDSKFQSGEELDLTLTAEFNLESETLIKYTPSEDLLNLMNLNEIEFEQFLKDTMGASYYLESDKIAKGDHSECIDGCNEEYTDSDGNKIKGRGACKANCWLRSISEALIKAIPSVIAALVK